MRFRIRKETAETTESSSKGNDGMERPTQLELYDSTNKCTASVGSDFSSRKNLASKDRTP